MNIESLRELQEWAAKRPTFGTYDVQRIAELIEKGDRVRYTGEPFTGDDAYGKQLSWVRAGEPATVSSVDWNHRHKRFTVWVTWDHESWASDGGPRPVSVSYAFGMRIENLATLEGEPLPAPWEGCKCEGKRYSHTVPYKGACPVHPETKVKE